MEFELVKHSKSTIKRMIIFAQIKTAMFHGYVCSSRRAYQYHEWNVDKILSL